MSAFQLVMVANLHFQLITKLACYPHRRSTTVSLETITPKVLQNCQIHEHSLSLMKFPRVRQFCHCMYMHFLDIQWIYIYINK